MDAMAKAVATKIKRSAGLEIIDSTAAASKTKANAGKKTTVITTGFCSTSQTETARGVSTHTETPLL